jgi:NADP-dependent 3-hydroxy acid dehydrogenase YdfG
LSVYSGAKFAVRAISEGLRQEVGDEHVGEIVVCPTAQA